MASRYWVGGTASWDGTAGTKWAATSGGAGGETVPTSADDVFLDANSGSGTVTLSTGWTCRSFDSTGFTGTIAGSTNGSVGDATAGASNNAWVWGSGITRTYNGQITFQSTSATTQNITSNGKSFGGRINFTGAGSSYQPSDTFNSPAITISVTAGTFSTNSQTVTMGAFTSTGSTTRSLVFDNSTVNCVSTGSGSWNCATTGLTISCTNATITVGGATASAFAGGGVTYGGTFIIQTPTTSGSGIISGANTFNNLTIQGHASKTATMALSANQTISGTLTLSGNSVTNRLWLASNVTATSRTLTCNGTVTASNLDLTDITGAGSASWDLSAITGKSGDAAGNSGITFTTAAAQTWSGTSGGNWSANAWTTRVPLPQDDVTVNAAFSASQTITFDMPRAGKSIDFTGVTGSPVLSTALVTVDIFGSLTLAAGLGTVAGLAMTFHGRGSFTLTTAGKTLGFVDMDAPSGTITQQDALTCGQLLSSTGRGTWNTSGYSVTCSDLVVGTSNTFTCVNSTVTVTSTSCSFSSSAGVTTTGSTLILSYTGASTVNFSPGNKTFPTLQFAPASGTLSILSSGTFGTASISSTGTRTIQVSAGSTLTFTGGASAMASGTSGNLITYQSSSGGNAFSVSSDTTLVCDYISLKDCTGAGTGKSHFAGSHSTNVSGNTFWSFSDLLQGEGASSGTGAATGVGASISGVVGDSSGVGTVTGVGILTLSGVGSSDGTGIVTGVGASTNTGVGSSDGVGATNGVGSLTTTGVGNSSGLGETIGLGGLLFGGVGDSQGVGVTTGIGNLLISGTGISSGTGEVLGVGLSTVSGVGDSSGSASVTAVISTTVSGTGESSGLGIVLGLSAKVISGLGISDGIGEALGTFTTVSGVVGSASGMAEDSCSSGNLIGVVGNSSCILSVAGIGSTTSSGVGNSSGLASVSGDLVAIADNVAPRFSVLLHQYNINL